MNFRRHFYLIPTMYCIFYCAFVLLTTLPFHSKLLLLKDIYISSLFKQFHGISKGGVLTFKWIVSLAYCHFFWQDHGDATSRKAMLFMVMGS